MWIYQQERDPDKQFQNYDDTPKADEESDEEGKKRERKDGPQERAGTEDRGQGIEDDPLKDPFEDIDPPAKKGMTKQELIDTLMKNPKSPRDQAEDWQQE